MKRIPWPTIAQLMNALPNSEEAAVAIRAGDIPKSLARRRDAAGAGGAAAADGASRDVQAQIAASRLNVLLGLGWFKDADARREVARGDPLAHCRAGA